MIHFMTKLRMFKAIMNYSEDSYYFKDKDSRFILVNKQKAQRHGIKKRSEIKGKTDFDFLSKDDAKKIFEEEQEIFRTGNAIICKNEMLTRIDGTTTWHRHQNFPFIIEKEKLLAFGV